MFYLKSLAQTRLLDILIGHVKLLEMSDQT